MMALRVTVERWPLRAAFRISRGARTEAVVVVAEIRDGDRAGRGECVPYARYTESVEGVSERIRGMAGALADGMTRESLQTALPPGAARNALDCALWDLEAKRAGARAWALAGLSDPVPLTCAYTLSLDAPERMREAAREHSDAPLLKIKLGGREDLERVAAVREGAPRARLVVDANEGWTPASYADIVPRLADLGVAMIEQPLPAGADEALADLPRPVPVCADESCHDRASLPGLAGRYDMVNIKLDKTGGLTEALRLRDAAAEAGLGIMVGCMVGTSLAMAPACLPAQGAAVVDLDGPLLLAEDREPGLRYEQGRIHPPEPAVWG